MKLLRLITSDTNFDFLSFKKIAFIFSYVIILWTVITLLINNLNYGIDFNCGIFF